MPIPRDRPSKKYVDIENWPNSGSRVLTLARTWWPRASMEDLVVSEETWTRSADNQTDRSCRVMVLEYNPQTPSQSR